MLKPDYTLSPRVPMKERWLCLRAPVGSVRAVRRYLAL